MAGPDVEGAVDEASDVELLEGYLTAFFHLCLIFVVLSVLELVGGSGAAAFNLYFCTEDPFAVELVVASHHKAWNAYGVAVFLGIALGVAIESVSAVVLEGGNHFAIAADAVFVPAAILEAVLALLCHGGRGDGQGCGKQGSF